MKLQFQGHDYQYAVEQSLLALFPQERPLYDPIAPEDRSWAQVSLIQEGPVWTARTLLRHGEKEAEGVSGETIPEDCGVYEAEREKQKIVKLSFFQAARAVTGVTPPWGALTGIRPGKLAARFLEEGRSEQETDRILRDTYFVSPQRRRMCIETARQGLSAAAALSPRDIALYIGIPFCPTRCAYCSFVSNSVEKSFALVEPYLQSLLSEVRSAGEMAARLGLRVRAFYMGGGTPTTLTAEQMDRLLTEVERSFDLSGCLEITIEAGRPDTISPEKLGVLKAHGTTRVSVNPQTMEDRVLQAIGRRHSAEDILRAMEDVRAARFDHVNMDLIAGLPEDSAEGFCRTLNTVLTLGADNITVHTLSLKKGSRITLENRAIPSPEEVGRMLDYSIDRLRNAGLAPYYLYRQKYMSGSFENTGWCVPGAEGLYNIYIMEELCSILSLGAGGSTKMVDARRGRIERVFNLKYPKEYIERPEKIQANQAAFAAFYGGAGECSAR
ncbi:coproporphyrinogen dehydrogenase HemZ [Oscillibacter hominis]|uniref:Coproporphyrinogen dehydrogenase HemZ n=1 Tax=Oscillibacter hominis TaxID=2763056 RepID=A0A7G9B3I3_9FIRM|nr:coproporphyrinogen dehydrogenase HemZ [Oscillibacter hominis]QNL44114.1 coproporphyrinogen dehydrogenase HemZ [Oscillibacter hominis]